ncbi:TRAP transporter small permease [Marinobacterium sp. MBR-109]|jgi:TRAP-type C4-dicarboxylate transport system permease small subunit|uniref:TRAP transporter small permease n=1 Tax=Marinobacterium sp. MBR-109 TaxID=3156462 RepID=UPI003394D33C
MKASLRASAGSREVVVLLYRHLLSGTAAIVMFMMMLVTLIDVLGRYLFSSPLNGAYELTELMLAAVIFLGLPLITAEGGHIAVDLLDSFFGSWGQRIQNGLIEVINVLAFGTFTWVLWEHALKVQRYADTTAVLQIPLSWLAFMMAITTGLATLALILRLLFGSSGLFAQGEQ